MNSKSTIDKKRLKQIWNQVPANYYEQGIVNNPLKKLWHSTKLRSFKEIVKGKKIKTLLDDGCASGHMANEISKFMPKTKITAVDVYEKAINFGKITYPHIKFIVVDSHKLPFKTGSFDLVVSYEVIEHVVDPLKYLKEIKRVIKKQGSAIVAMDSGVWLFRLVWWISEKTISKVWQNAHLHPFNHMELESLIKKSGLKIIKKKFSHFGMEVSFLLQK